MQDYLPTDSMDETGFEEFCFGLLRKLGFVIWTGERALGTPAARATPALTSWPSCPNRITEVLAVSDAIDSNAPKADPSILAWVEDAVGGRLLAYLLGCDVSDLPALIAGHTTPTKKQLDAIANFSLLREKNPLYPAEPTLSMNNKTADNDSAPYTDVLCMDEGSPREKHDDTGLMLQIYLMQLTQDGQSISRLIREHVVGPEAVPDGNDNIERALIALAIDAYPACLLPISPALPPEIYKFGPSIEALLFRHPQSKAFSNAVRNDETLKYALTTEEERNATVYRKTGNGGEIGPPFLLSQLLLQSAWRKLLPDELTLSSFVTAALEQLRLVRDVFAGKPRNITAKLAFTGILLPPGRKLELSDGLVRAINEAERGFVPKSLKGQLSGSDASGVSTTVNYDGDVVLEYALPYKMQARHGREEPQSSWRIEMRLPFAMEQSVMRLRYSLLLAVKRDYKVQLIQTWRAFDEPLNYGVVMSWSDPRQGAGFTPAQLTDAEVEAWGKWYERLKTPHVAKIDLALTRILRAIAERREPSDVLIDAVIAWENLFGTNVTMSLAKLLEQAPEARLDLRAKLSKIYDLRSKIVHGGGTLKEVEYPLCNEALDIAIQAVEVLLIDREDILKLSGAKRSESLLLGP